MSAEDFTPTVDVRTSMQRAGRRPRTYERAKNPGKALARLAHYLLPYQISIAIVSISVILSSIVGLAGPYLLGQAVDAIRRHQDISNLGQFLMKIALLMIGVYLVSNVLQIVANWIMARISQDALKELRRDLFTHIETLSMSFFDTHSSGGLMSRLTNDIDAVNQAVSQNVINLFTSIITMAGIIIAMFVINPILALVVLLIGPIMAWFTRFVSRFTRKGFRDLQRSLGELNGIAEEAISGQKVVKAFRRGDSTIAAFREKNEAVFKAGVYANSYALLLTPLTGVIGNLFVILLASFGGWLALRNIVSVGTIAMFINYGQNFTQPLRQIGNLYNSVQAALAGSERVFEIIDTPSEVDAGAPVNAGTVKAAHELVPQDKSSSIRGDVEFIKVSFSYVTGKPIIKEFSLKVSAGETIALVGPTGAGKTTIINLLTRFYELDSGSITIDGIDIRKMPKDDLRCALGLVLQDNFLFADSVMENIRYGRLSASDDECVHAAQLAEADHFIRQLPQGYATMLSERAGNLSQGQRQLLAIARVILADPAILVLDEATSNVDTRTELRIQKALLALMKGRTSFVIAHRLSTIKDADTVVVIDDGRIVEQGTHDELLARKGFYARLYLSQFKGNAL